MKLVRINTDDMIELVGVLYEPLKKTNKIVIHIHGLSGNFYENKFLDYQAKSYVDNGYAYFVFNNRGSGYFSYLIKNNNNSVDFILGGSAYENFNESYLDIKSAVDYVGENGFNEIILQGYSYGCNKVVNYCEKIENKKIKKIILLAPGDICNQLKNDVDEYEKYIGVCQKKVAEDRGSELVFSNAFPPEIFSAQTVLNGYLKNSNADIFRFRESNYTRIKKIKIPVLVQIGSNDDFSLAFGKEKVTKFLTNNFNNIKIDIIENTDHDYCGKESELSGNCVQFLNTSFKISMIKETNKVMISEFK